LDPGQFGRDRLSVRHRIIWISCLLSRFDFQLRLEPRSAVVWQYRFAMGVRPQWAGLGFSGGEARNPFCAIDRFGTCCCRMSALRKDASALAVLRDLLRTCRGTFCDGLSHEPYVASTLFISITLLGVVIVIVRSLLDRR